MKRIIVAALVIVLALMAGCVEEETTPTATPTTTPTVTETQVLTTPAAEGVEPSGHWATCISCHVDSGDHISQYAADCTPCHGSGENAIVHDKEGHSDLGCLDSECHK